MSATINQRAKLLYLMKIMLKKTDEAHPLTTAGLAAELAAYGVTAERKTIYADLELLRRFGLDIETTRGKSVGYYIASRRFELPELKLLVDAAQSSRFITAKKSEELISKLSSLTSETQAKELRRQVHVSGRAKSCNESAYYSVDAIHAAINGAKKVAFKYFDYDVKKNRIYRKNGEIYKVTPLALCWNEDKYYMIAYNADYGEVRHYRVDRMGETAVLDEPADQSGNVEFDVASHIKSIFGMYSGDVVRAVLSFDNSLVNVALDYFGKDIHIQPGDDGRFEIRADVSVSPVFLGWVFQFGGKVVIKEPESLVSGMKSFIKANIEIYGL